MGSTSYNSKLRDNRWQRKRLEIMERDSWTCRSCGASGDGVSFNVHHAYYEKGLDPWEYDSQYLSTLCDKCHALLHKAQIEIQKMVATLNQTELAGLVKLIDVESQVVENDSVLSAMGFAEWIPNKAIVELIHTVERARCRAISESKAGEN